MPPKIKLSSRRLYESAGISLEPEANIALRHIKTISTIRNNIINYGAAFDGNSFMISSAAHIYCLKSKDKNLPLDDFGNTTASLIVLSHRFMAMTARHLPNAFPEAIDRLAEIACNPLQYKQRPENQLC